MRSRENRNIGVARIKLPESRIILHLRFLLEKSQISHFSIHLSGESKMESDSGIGFMRFSRLLKKIGIAPSLVTNKRGVSRNCNCEAKIIFKIKLTTKNTKKRDSYVRDGMPCVIKIFTKHSHPLASYEVLKYLPSDGDVQRKFFDYFEAGMGAKESIKHHLDLLDMMDSSEEDFSNARINPTYRTVSYWFEMYRNERFGSKLNADIDELLEEKKKNYENDGIIIVHNKDPFYVFIATPLMQRAHTIPDSKKHVFIDSTSSCDSSNHSITLISAACGAGAIPLGVLITEDQKTETFVAGFNALKRSLKNSFCQQGYPDVIITDNCTAEINAIREVWPNSLHFLCIFHVLQYVWRWLHDSKNGISQTLQRSFYTNFQTILYCTKEEDAENAYYSSLAIAVTNKSEQWEKYLQRQWEIKEKWCLAYRVNLVQHHTNNFAEISVRIFKDNVLGRIKTYNVMAMIEFVCSTMEVFYQRKLRDFADGRNSKQRLVLRRTLKKAVYLKSSDISKISESEYAVPSEGDRDIKYVVNAQDGLCDCEAGKLGKFCKHLAAVFKFFNTMFDKVPNVTMEYRKLMAFLAFGKEVNDDAFLPLHITEAEVNNILQVENMENVKNVEIAMEPNECFSKKNDAVLEIPPITDENVMSVIDDEDNDNEKSLDVSHVSNEFVEVLAKMVQLQKRFGGGSDGNIEGIRKFSRRLSKISSPGVWDTFIHTAASNVPLRHSGVSKIRVQPTSISRRKTKKRHNLNASIFFS